MANVLIAYDNQADDATLTVGGWAEFAGPLDNLRDWRVSKKAVSLTDAEADTKFRFALAAPAHIGALSVLATNASQNATYRWRLFSDAAFTTVIYDSGTLDLYPAGTVPAGTIPFGAPNWWTGKPLTSEIERFQRNIVHILTDAQYARYGDFQLGDTGNPDGVFEAGRFFVGSVFRPAHNASYGAQVARLKSRSAVQRARDGTPYFEVRRPDFCMPVSFDWLTQAEAMQVLDLQATVDLHGEVLMLWDHEDLAWSYRRQVLGRLAELDPIVHPLFTTYRTSFQVEGVL